MREAMPPAAAVVPVSDAPLDLISCTAYGRPMKSEQTDCCIILLLAGLIVSAVGTLEYTGFTHTFIPDWTVFAGYVLVAAGIVLFYKDRRDNAAVLEDYDCDLALTEVLSSFPDDGYVIDLRAEGGAAEGADMPPIDDLSETFQKTEVPDVPKKGVFSADLDIAGDEIPAEKEHLGHSGTEAPEKGIFSADLDIAGGGIPEEKERLGSADAEEEGKE